MLADWRMAVGKVINAWFPDRKLLLLGPEKVSTITISQRLQVFCVALVLALSLWFAGSSVGIALAMANTRQLPTAVPSLRASLAQAQARVRALDLQYAAVTAARDAAVAQADALSATALAHQATVAGATAAVARADAARDAAMREASAARQQNSALLGGLLAQTQATIGQVDAIIKSTGLNPVNLAARGTPKPGMPNGTGREAGAVALPPGMPPAQQSTAAQLALNTGRLQLLEAAFAQIPLVSPLAHIAISSPFGYRASPFTGVREFHVGIDLTGAIGTPVYATAPGVVSYAGGETGYGNLVTIDHGYGLSTRYSHLSRILVTDGAKVSLHQVIGLLGNTGWSTGPHLLYETRVDGAPQNPLDFIKVNPNDVQN